MQRAARRLAFVLGMEKPVVFPGERIAFTRTVCTIPEILTVGEWNTIRETHHVHEMGKVCNISPDYRATIGTGLDARRLEAVSGMKASAGHEEQISFLQAVVASIDAVLDLTDRYAGEARRIGNAGVAEVLDQVPRHPARTFHEALQSFRILHFALWSSFNYHNTVGRFDQYMFPYLKADLEAGRLDEDEAFDLLEEFFLSFNRDSDLYPGMQQGDNGQSMVLGGMDDHGHDAYNLLSEMCLRASLDLKLIDPKINLRVSHDTDLSRYELGTQLTRQGLGFPQYSNDDVVIPGLTAKGYSLEDARNYVVAACWEFIIPGVGMDIPNIGALSFARVVDRAVHGKLAVAPDFETFMDEVEREIQVEIDAETGKFRNLYMEPAPFLSVLMRDCIAQARDISFGSRYNNYGLHGTGLANAADSLAAIRMVVYDEKTVTPEVLIQAIDADFEGYDMLLGKLRHDTPKMGSDNDAVDKIAVRLLDLFALSLQGRSNDRGGCWRAGTGSAMYYVWHSRDIGASPDGRKKGEFLSANYSPSLHARPPGPVSVIRSFTKPHLQSVINGGPLTLELHDSVFRNEESIWKVAMLVKSFIEEGGHQIQLNAVNRETLLEAQEKPDLYRNLIVRVWGWSGYFVELDKEYQDHIIQRVEMKL